MPPAVNRSALALYSHRLVEDGCRFRLHASPEKSPYLYVREIVDGERLRQFSLAPLEWVTRPCHIDCRAPLARAFVDQANAPAPLSSLVLARPCAAARIGQTYTLSATVRPCGYHEVVDEPLLRRIAAEIQAAIPGAEVRLFESRTRSTARPDSDMDLLVTVPDAWLEAHSRLEQTKPWAGRWPMTARRLSFCSSLPARWHSAERQLDPAEFLHDPG